jgi:UDP-N-acetylglucosamine--N-acetylmuramyl-(pentapeptide) pyrophosphoryl-undecaprenol N-acetylglucosamine transferase
MRKLKIIISGGGTGGHIFPAIAIAKSIEKSVLDVEFLFVGANDRMEMQKVPAEGYRIIGLWISGIQRGFSKRNILFPFKVLHSIVKAKNIVKEFKPDLAIGTGGYASAPLLYVAAKKGIPTLIQEQNSYPGITNKILSKYVQKICVAYDGMDRFFSTKKLIHTGNPIRREILGFETKKVIASMQFKIDVSKPTILVIGGSLGALSINNAIANNIQLIMNLGINLIWQTGAMFKIRSEECLLGINSDRVSVHTFIEEMDHAYAVSDIIISRAGAIAISELCCIGKPVILIPSPNVSENHQYKNAQSLVNKNAALLVEDSNANSKLVYTLKDLLNNEDLMVSLGSNIKKIAVTNAADKIAKIALGLVK